MTHLFLVLFLLVPALAMARDIHVSTTKAPAKIDILVPDFKREGNFIDPEARDKRMADILQHDLEFSGLFRVVRVADAGTDKQKWRDMGPPFIFLGSYSTDGREIWIEGKLYNAATGDLIFSNKHDKGVSLMRQRTHQLADHVIFQLTGEKGIATSRIAFTSDATGSKELYVMDYDGHNIRQLTFDKSIAMLPKWSQDGSYILFTTFRRGVTDLAWISPDGSRRGTFSAQKGLNTSGSVSPSGEWVVLTLSKDGNPEIYLMSKDGKQSKRLTTNQAIDTAPSWSPNGREIVFTSDRVGSPQIYIMDAEGANVRRLTFNSPYNDSAAWSPNGDLIAYTVREGRGFNIYVTSPTGGNPLRITQSGENENPTWSPDGRWIAFSGKRTGKGSIYVTRPDGSEPASLGSFTGNCYAPAWSPRVAIKD